MPEFQPRGAGYLLTLMLGFVKTENWFNKLARRNIWAFFIWWGIEVLFGIILLIF